MRRLLILACALLACHASRAPAGEAGLRVGQQSLARCAGVPGWCGSLRRPLDPTGTTPGTIDIYFEYYPHTAAGPARGTVVPIEGGPGYPSTGSRQDYLALLGPLRTGFDMLIMDARGTGRSGAIDCQPLQHAERLTAADIGACGRSLGDRARFYSAAQSADDLAALLDALGIARIDLYGDSYGTYASQVFAYRHGNRLRSLILDGAYALDGEDYPWYPHYAPAMRHKFERACEQSPACRAVPGGSLAHIEPALALLRAEPADVTTRDDAGQPAAIRADPGALATVMFGASPALITLRETDAAARAYAQGDRRPLLRLMAEALAGTDSRSEDRSPLQFSEGMAAAVFCQDPPQVYDLNLPLEARRAQYEAELAHRRLLRPGPYSPFELDEYRAMPIDYAFIDECIEWPAPASGEPRLPLIGAGAPAPEVPVLVISGELDDITPPEGAAEAAAGFPHASHLVIANGLHVNALPRARSPCGALLARRFIATLSTGETGCIADAAAIRLVPVFAPTVAAMPAAGAVRGHAAGDLALRAAAVALQACEDVLSRALLHGPGTQQGLRGGSFAVTERGGGVSVRLRGLRWTEDLALSGRLSARGRSDEVRADLSLAGPGAATGSLQLRFPRDGVAGAAVVRGLWQGRAVRARVDF